jgi:hypothetical protein
MRRGLRVERWFRNRLLPVLSWHVQSLRWRRDVLLLYCRDVIFNGRCRVHRLRCRHVGGSGRNLLAVFQRDIFRRGGRFLYSLFRRDLFTVGSERLHDVRVRNLPVCCGPVELHRMRSRLRVC